MSGAKLYRRKSVPPLKAVQFKGWQNASEIYRWGAPVFYVPRAAEHPLRRDNEFDRSNGHILETAPEFFFLQIEQETQSEPSRYARLFVGDWVCLDNDRVWFARSDAAFRSEFEEEPTSGSGTGGGGAIHV